MEKSCYQSTGSQYLSADTIITVDGLANNFGSLLDLVGKSTVDPLEEIAAPQSIDKRAF
jgi:hypothetical protein